MTLLLLRQGVHVGPVSLLQAEQPRHVAFLMWLLHVLVPLAPLLETLPRQLLLHAGSRQLQQQQAALVLSRLCESLLLARQQQLLLLRRECWQRVTWAMLG